MAELFSHIDHWHWWILAVVLVVVEIMVPGTFFMWMGISAGLVGLLVLIAPGMGWEYQVLAFAVLSMASIMAWLFYFRKHPVQSDQPTLNRRGEQYVGRTFTLTEPMENNSGKLRVDDTTWKINGEDCDSGSKVKVVGVNGVILKVEVVD